MRKVILWASVSLDGYYEGPGGDISWHQVSPQLHAYFNDEIATHSAFLEGRRTHQLMTEFWPTADEDPANAGPVAEFAEIWRRITKIVYSRTLTAADAPWADRLERRVDVGAVAALKAQPGGDMTVGGADLAATFLELGLVDEVRLFVVPVLLGAGRLLFAPTGRAENLRLVENRTFDGGIVMLRHEVVRETSVG